jgi:hypothetical protein
MKLRKTRLSSFLPLELSKDTPSMCGCDLALLADLSKRIPASLAI